MLSAVNKIAFWVENGMPQRNDGLTFGEIVAATVIVGISLIFSPIGIFIILLLLGVPWFIALILALPGLAILGLVGGAAFVQSILETILGKNKTPHVPPHLDNINSGRSGANSKSARVYEDYVVGNQNKQQSLPHPGKRSTREYDHGSPKARKPSGNKPGWKDEVLPPVKALGVAVVVAVVVAIVGTAMPDRTSTPRMNQENSRPDVESPRQASTVKSANEAGKNAPESRGGHALSSTGSAILKREMMFEHPRGTRWSIPKGTPIEVAMEEDGELTTIVGLPEGKRVRLSLMEDHIERSTSNTMASPNPSPSPAPQPAQDKPTPLDDLEGLALAEVCFPGMNSSSRLPRSKRREAFLCVERVLQENQKIAETLERSLIGLAPTQESVASIIEAKKSWEMASIQSCKIISRPSLGTHQGPLPEEALNICTAADLPIYIEFLQMLRSIANGAEKVSEILSHHPMCDRLPTKLLHECLTMESDRARKNGMSAFVSIFGEDHERTSRLSAEAVVAYDYTDEFAHAKCQVLIDISPSYSSQDDSVLFQRCLWESREAVIEFTRDFGHKIKSVASP